MCHSFFPHLKHADHCAKCSHARRLHPAHREDLAFFSPSVLLAKQSFPAKLPPAPMAYSPERSLSPYAKTPNFSRARGTPMPESPIPRVKSALLPNNAPDIALSSESYKQLISLHRKYQRSPADDSRSTLRTTDSQDSIGSTLKSGSRSRPPSKGGVLSHSIQLLAKSRSKSPEDRSTSRKRVVGKPYGSTTDREDAVQQSLPAARRSSPYRLQRSSRSNTPPTGLRNSPSRVFVIPSPQKSPIRLGRCSPRVPTLDLNGVVVRNRKEVVSEYFAGANMDTLPKARQRKVDFRDEYLRLVFMGAGHCNTVTDVCKISGKLLTSSSDYTLRQWSIPKLSTEPYKATASDFLMGSVIPPTHSFRAHKGPIYSVVEVPWGRSCTAGGDSVIKVRTTQVWAESQLLRTLRPQSSMFSLLRLGQDCLVSGGSEGRILTWDVEKGVSTSRLALEHCKPVRCLSATAAHTFLSASEDTSVKLWDVRLPGSVACFLGHSSPVHGLCWRDQSMYSGDEDGTLHIWDIRTRALMETLNAAESINSLLIVDNVLVTAGDTITLWLPAGPHRLAFHTGKVTKVKMVSETLMCTTSSDGSLAVWSFSHL